MIDELVPEGLFDPLQCVKKLLTEREKGVAWKCRPFFLSRLQRCRGKQFQPRAGCREIAGRQPGVQPVAGRLDLGRFVAGLAQVGLNDRLDNAGPVIMPGACHQRYMRRAQGDFMIQIRIGRGGDNVECRVLVMTFERFRQFGRGVARAAQKLQETVRLAHDACSPIVVTHIMQDGALIADHLRIEQGTAFEGVFQQGPLTKSMNSEDGGIIESVQGPGQELDGLCRVDRPLGEQDFLQGIPRGAAAAEQAQGVIDAGANPVAQFGRCRFGIGYHQDFFRPQAAFQQQQDVQGTDRPGFAGSGAGFDQVETGGRQGCQVKVFHRVLSSLATARIGA